jgi:pimeloyl-ACP methyl ester carboxylesterase
MNKTALLLVPGMICSPRLYADQVAALSGEAEIVVPDWRRAPLAIWDSWESAARWVVDQMPAGEFALAGLSLGGMLAVEIMQFAAERVTKLALLDTGMRSQNEAERAIRRARIRLATEGHFELVLGMQMSRFIPAYRLPDKKLVDQVMAMCGEIGVEIYKRQEELAAIRADRRPDLPRIKCPTIVVCGRAAGPTPLFLSEEMAAAIKGSELIVIEQCGHLVTMEKPEETNAILRRWLG